MPGRRVREMCARPARNAPPGSARTAIACATAHSAAVSPSLTRHVVGIGVLFAAAGSGFRAQADPTGQPLPDPSQGRCPKLRMQRLPGDAVARAASALPVCRITVMPAVPGTPSLRPVRSSRCGIGCARRSRRASSGAFDDACAASAWDESEQRSSLTQAEARLLL